MNANRKKLKKRHIVIAVLVVEILSLPVSAHIIRNYEAPKAPTIASAEIALQKSGQTQFLVTSDAPFVVIATGVSGAVTTHIKQSGMLGNISYGHNAQMPGKAEHCVVIKTPNAHIVYQSQQGTYTQDAETLDRTILLDLEYPASESPDFQILPAQDATKTAKAQACQT